MTPSKGQVRAGIGRDGSFGLYVCFSVQVWRTSRQENWMYSAELFDPRYRLPGHVGE